VTKYYTSSTYVPVREFAETQKQSAATGIIHGLALHYLSCIVPVCCLAVTVRAAHSSAACSVWPSAPSACL
jgi:Na+/H+-translocating membrane pyrophosphatase